MLPVGPQRVAPIRNHRRRGLQSPIVREGRGRSKERAHATASIRERAGSVSNRLRVGHVARGLVLDVVEERGEGGREGHRQAVGPSGGPEQCRRCRRTASRIRSKADQRRSRCALEPDPQSSSLPAVQKFVALTAPSPPPSHPDAQEDPTATTRGRARCGTPCAPDPGSAARVPSTARPTPRARRDPPRRRAEEASWSRAGTLPRIPRCSSSR